MPIGRAFLLSLTVLAAAAQAADISVSAVRNGEALDVEASAEFAGTTARAWQVLTDYGRFAEFVPSLELSRVVSRSGNGAVVEQRGAARLLFLSFPMDVRLAVTEFPRERIVSEAVGGNFREMRNAYTLEARQGRIVLRYAGRLVPDFYVPPLVGTYVLRRNVENTFRALVEEIERGQQEPRKP
jgi:hypothetical protein